MRRRDLATAVTTGIVLPAFVGSASARAERPLAKDGLQQHMLAALSKEIDDSASARTLVPHIEDVGFDWQPDTAPVAQLDFIVAYAFGNRLPAGGGDPAKVLADPGPTNEALADAVAAVLARRQVHVYAQWEIARWLKSKYGISNLTSVEPVIAADGTITYLSTDGVAAQVLAARAKLPGGIGTAAVVGFRDHIKRCVQTTRDRGMAAFAPAGIPMPGTYDPQSGQPWTRRRDLYLVHDMYAQWATLRAKLIAQAYPNG